MRNDKRGVKNNMEEQIRWRFPSNNYGENKGFNDSGVEHFTDNVTSSLAREICQNSLDAAISDDVCVEVEFKLFEISSNKIPGKVALSDVFDRLSDYWQKMIDPKGKTICKGAKAILDSPTCKVLRISDFNTTGLSHIKDTDRLSPWYNLVKFTGASDKAGDAGGSYGIGKYSSFACSTLRTVFYSTCNSEGEIAYQGVSRLATFKNEKGETTQGIGYFGNDKNEPVYDEFLLDPDFRRGFQNFGTDIYILGYKGDSDVWEKEIICSILKDFFYAIHLNKLSINVNGTKINNLNISNIIKSYANDENRILDKLTPLYYNALLTAEQNNLFFQRSFYNMGTLKIWLIAKEEDNGKKTVAMIRKTGMKIYDDSRCTGNLNVVGVCYIEGKELNNKLKDLENPAHTGWSAERSTNPSVAKRLLKELRDQIKDIIIDRFSHSEVESVDAMGIGKYLPDMEESGNITKKKIILSNEIEKVRKRKRKLKKKGISTQAATEGNDESFEKGSGEEHFSPEADGDIPVPYKHHNDDETQDQRKGSQDPAGEETKNVRKAYKATTLSKFLPVCVNAKEGRYALIINPSCDADDGKISLFISAETDKYPVSISQVRLIKGKGTPEIEDNTIQGLEFKKSEEMRLMVHLDFNEACALEVEAYANKR